MGRKNSEFIGAGYMDVIRNKALKSLEIRGNGPRLTSTCLAQTVYIQQQKGRDTVFLLHLASIRKLSEIGYVCITWMILEKSIFWSIFWENLVLLSVGIGYYKPPFWVHNSSDHSQSEYWSKPARRRIWHQLTLNAQIFECMVELQPAGQRLRPSGPDAFSYEK